MRRGGDTGHVSKIEPVSAEMVRAQIEVLLKSFPVAAIKTGLLFSGEIVSTVARRFEIDSYL